jgi:RHS repeat-associated protein
MNYNNKSKHNFTKGNLVSTAYRTRKSDKWSFKYYRYDERGRVTRMWNIIYGLEEKNIRYQYNSQDQITQVNYGYESEYKRYSYYYDYAGRLGTLNYANADPSIDIDKSDKSAPDINFSSYTYNPNSLLDFQFFNSSRLHNQYRYNSRNWITEINSAEGVFGFTNTYFKNGNLQNQLLYGTYKDFMKNKYNLNYTYSYDNSNRLLTAVNTNQGDNTYSTYNTYDKDGNILTLRRYGDNNIIADNFNYQYFPNTNKVRFVSGATDQYNYDLNGNTVLDDVNGNYDIKYDYRNLVTEIYHKDPASVTRPNTFATRYYYDESGNRVRKLVYINSQLSPPSITDWTNPGDGWVLLNNEFYVKGVDGKDLAIYKGNILDEWFVWGNDLVGKIKGDKQYYYYKDHIGSVRAVVDNAGAIVAGYDYDAWGYPLENRDYNGDSIKFKYTGKEFDKESYYDYFGARYYDARIGRWGQIDPLLNKYLSVSPFCYTLNNPIILTDPTGMWIPEFNSSTNHITVKAEEGDNIQSLTTQLGISSEDLALLQDINHVNRFVSEANNFDITNLVISNSNFNATSSNSNCFGFVSISLGKSSVENELSGSNILSYLGENTSELNTGDIAIFFLESDFTTNFIDPFTGKRDSYTASTKNDPQHAAIYLLTNKSGEKQFLNRLNTGHSVTINSLSDIINYFSSQRQALYEQSGILMPSMNPNPNYYLH